MQDKKKCCPLDGAQVTNNYEAPSFVSTNGLQLNSQMLTSLWQMPNYGQHPQVLNRQNQDAVLSQEPGTATIWPTDSIIIWGFFHNNFEPNSQPQNEKSTTELNAKVHSEFTTEQKERPEKKIRKKALSDMTRENIGIEPIFQNWNLSNSATIG